MKLYVALTVLAALLLMAAPSFAAVDSTPVQEKIAAVQTMTMDAPAQLSDSAMASVKGTGGRYNGNNSGTTIKNVTVVKDFIVFISFEKCTFNVYNYYVAPSNNNGGHGH